MLHTSTEFSRSFLSDFCSLFFLSKANNPPVPLARAAKTVCPVLLGYASIAPSNEFDESDGIYLQTIGENISLFSTLKKDIVY